MIADGRHVDAPTNIAGFDPTREAGSCHYSPEVADKAVAFFNDCLVYLDGEKRGEPFQLENWQADIIRTAFGWIRTDGTRRFKKIFWFIPRKNGKTTIAAGMALKCFFADQEYRAQCYCAAADKEQASLLFDMARDQIQANPDLMEVVKIQDTWKRIQYREKHSLFRALATNDAGGHGMNLHFGAYDEFHLWNTERHKEQYMSLHTSTGVRRQPLELIITTAGFDTESICFKEYERAKKIRDGEIDDDSYLPVIYEAEEDDDWTDPETWAKANPNLDVTISSDYIERECKRAQEDPSYENVFKRLHLNIWTEQENRWLQMEHWRKCNVTEEPIGHAPIGGLDLSQVRDFSALSMIERLPGGGLRVRNHYWLPQETAVEYVRKRNLSIEEWVRGGWLTLIPGAHIDQNWIKGYITEQGQKVGLRTVGYDPWTADQMRIDLEHEGFEMIKVRQGYASLTQPSKELERQILAHSLDHGNDPILDWMAAQAVCVRDENGNIRPTKDNEKAKIDGLVATIIAIHALQVKLPEKPLIYETAGMLGI